MQALRLIEIFLPHGEGRTEDDRTRPALDGLGTYGVMLA